MIYTLTPYKENGVFGFATNYANTVIEGEQSLPGGTRNKLRSNNGYVNISWSFQKLETLMVSWNHQRDEGDSAEVLQV